MRWLDTWVADIASHRIASQPLLSDVNKEKGEDELGEKKQRFSPGLYLLRHVFRASPARGEWPSERRENAFSF